MRQRELLQFHDDEKENLHKENKTETILEAPLHS